MIKLRDLIVLKEQQAPTGPTPAPAAPTPTPPAAPAADPAADPAAQADAAPSEDQPTGSGAEYDFTKDFRAYQDTVNKADNSAKKNFIKKANEQLMGKTVTANASRGYGQPKSDYTIEEVKKVSVDFYYKEDVVVLTDKNDKKYFLTPGVNIKVEESQPTPEEPAAEAPPGEEPTAQAPQGAEQPPAEPAGPAEPPMGAPGQAPEAPAPESPSPQAPAAPEAEPQAQTPPPEDLKKKKKKPLPVPPVAEVVQRDIGEIFEAFVKPSALNAHGKFLVGPYLKKHLRENVSDIKIVRYELDIPKSLFEGQLDVRDFQLATVDKMRSVSGKGQQFIRGSVDITPIGKSYLFEFKKHISWGM